VHVFLASLDYPDREGGGGGVGSYAQALGQGLVRRGHQVTVAALPGSHDREGVFDDEGVRVVRRRPGQLHYWLGKFPLIGPVFSLPLRELEYARLLSQVFLAEHRRAPVSLVEGTETGGFLLARHCPRLQVRYQVMLHGERYTFAKYTPTVPMTAAIRLSRVIQRNALRRACRLSAPSQAHAREAESELGLAPGTVCVRAHAGPDHREDGDPRSAAVRDVPLLYAGRIEPRKGIDCLLAAFARLARASREAKLLVVGSFHPTYPENRFRSECSRRGIAKRVEIRGRIPRSALLELLRRTRVFVCPSFYETFGYAALEALEAGCRVVLTDIPVFRELFGESVVYFPAGDDAALAAALKQCLASGATGTRLPGWNLSDSDSWLRAWVADATDGSKVGGDR